MPPPARRRYALQSSNYEVEAGLSRHDFSTVIFPSATIQVTTYRSGGDLSSGGHQVPGDVDYGRLVLRRPLISGDRELWEWWRSARDRPTSQRDVTVRILSAAREPGAAWTFSRAFPASYELSELDATSGETVTETVALAFDSMDAV